MTQRGADSGSDALVRPPARSVRTVLPILEWLPRYAWGRELSADVLAGVAVAALLIPESMGYAGVAGVPTQVGLYAALVAVAAYAVTGGVSILVVGPASAVAALSASLVAEFHGDVDRVVLTAALALTTGVLLVAAGILRMGWIVNFISRPVLEAFVAGLSIAIVIGQLPGLLGVEVDGESPVAALAHVIRHVGDWHGLTVAIGLGSVAALVVLERFARRVPGAIVVVGAGIAIATLSDMASRGVAVVGEVPQGLPAFGVPELAGVRWLELLAGGAALLLVGFSEGYAAASAVAAHTGESVDPDQELVAAGAANVVAGLAGGLAVSGSLSKSAASQTAGARTQVANVVAGLMVLATLVFLAPAFEDLPEPVLAAVVIVAVLPSADPRRALALWGVNQFDFVASAATFTLVLVWETLPAMVVGVLLSLAFLVRRASFPDVVELRLGDDRVFHRVREDEPDAAPLDVLVLRLDAALVYANAERLKRAAAALVARHPTATRFVLDGEMFSDLDATGAAVLAELDDELSAQGIELHLARVHHRARAQIDRSGLRTRFAGRVHTTLGMATGTKGR